MCNKYKSPEMKQNFFLFNLTFDNLNVSEVKSATIANSKSTPQEEQCETRRSTNAHAVNKIICQGTNVLYSSRRIMISQMSMSILNC